MNARSCLLIDASGRENCSSALERSSGSSRSLCKYGRRAGRLAAMQLTYCTECTYITPARPSRPSRAGVNGSFGGYLYTRLITTARLTLAAWNKRTVPCLIERIMNGLGLVARAGDPQRQAYSLAGKNLTTSLSQPMKRERQLTTTKPQAVRPSVCSSATPAPSPAQSISILAVAVGAGVAKAE
jgi:hypothetical protein